MTNRRDEILAKLLGLPTPRQDGSQDRKWLDYLGLGLTEADLPVLANLMLDACFDEADDRSQEVWVPLHCWRALGQLRTAAALDSILAFRDMQPDDDWLSEDLIQIALLIGPEALPALAAYLADESKDEYNLSDVAECIGRLGTDNPDIKAECVHHLSHRLERFKHNTPFVNAVLVLELAKLRARDSMDLIRRAFEADAVDISIGGDLEDAEIEMELRSQRSTPRPQFEWVQEPQAFADLPDERRASRPPAQQPIHRGVKIGRNDPCPCGSGKKYKKCCLN